MGIHCASSNDNSAADLNTSCFVGDIEDEAITKNSAHPHLLSSVKSIFS